MNEQSSAGSQVVYQTTVLTPDMVQTMIMDDSPDVIFNKLWQFFGVDIPVADIKPFDFKNVLDFVDLAFVNMLQEHPEKDWENIAIVEIEMKLVKTMVCKKCGIKYEFDEKLKNCPECKKPVEEAEESVENIKRGWKVIELWDAVRAKVYLKMCRAREGFNLRQLTEKRSFLEERVHGVPMPAGLPQEPQEKKKGGWKIW